MDATIDIKSLEEAVTVFYRSGAQQQSNAHEWLTKAQLSPQAWSFVWDLMQLGKSSEIQFFGATTLHTKLLKHWHEVPKENRDELQQKLFAAIIVYANGPKIVLNRLCISLSAFIVHMISEHPTAIEDIVNTFQSQQMPNVNQETQSWILMEILGAIPEETNVMYTSVQRVTIQNEISKRTPFVINTVQQFLLSKSEQILSDDDMVTLLRAVKCCEAWIKNGSFPLDNCEVLTGALLKLVNKCYWNTTDSEGCMTSNENELSEACIKALTTMLIQPDAHRFPNSALHLLNIIIESLSHITKAEWKESNLNEDIAFNIYTLFISAIECHSRLLIGGVLSESAEHRNLYMKAIHEILQCTDKPGIYPVEESCSILSMGFWYMLQDEVLSNDSVMQIKNKGLELIGPLYSHLAKILVRKAQQPDEESLDKWTVDDLETFRCYRQDISDTLLYCFEVLHNHLLEILITYLNECIVNIQHDPTQWTQLEACIYAIYSIAEHIETDEVVGVPKFIITLSEIPYDKLHEKLLGTALDSIGAYSEWFKDNPTYIPHAIRVLVIGLNSSQTAQASLGLKDLCRECQNHLRPYAEPLLQACLQAVGNGHLINSDEVRLMYSIGKLMSMLSHEDVLRWLDVVVSPCFTELQSLLQSQSLNDASKIRTTFRLNMISTLFSSLNTRVKSMEEDAATAAAQSPEAREQSAVTQPVLLIMQKTMPIFKDIATLWINETSVIEALCSGLKYAITNLLDDFTPMLPDLCTLIVAILNSKCVAPAIDIAKTCIFLYYKNPTCTPIMRQLLIQVILYNFQLFEQTPVTDRSAICDVIESFLNFNALIAKKTPNAFDDPEIDCDRLIGYATKVLVLPETGVAKNAVIFLQHFIIQSRAFRNATNAILKNGEELVQTTIMCIAVYSQRTHVDVFADVFVALNKKYPAEMIAWLKCLEVNEFPINSVSAVEKERFMKAIIREKVNKRLVQGLIREFSAKCRDVIIQIP